jgi:hypothetical protein
LQQWYRTLDQLLERKERIEQALYLRLRPVLGPSRQGTAAPWRA